MTSKYYRCWRCGWKRYEWTRWRKCWEDRARCFFCRIDALDDKYGPSLIATMYKDLSKDGEYVPCSGFSFYDYKLRSYKWTRRKNDI